MNLMFRKNFRESSGRSTGGGKLTSKASRSQGKKSRDLGFQNDAEAVHYRTHIFFSATSSRTTQQSIYEERCGPVTGAANSFLPTTSCDVDVPQPLIDRRPSVSLLKWTLNDTDTSITTNSKQGLNRIQTNPSFQLHFKAKNK